MIRHPECLIGFLFMRRSSGTITKQRMVPTQIQYSMTLTHFIALSSNSDACRASWLYSLYMFPRLTCPLCAGRMWTWGRRWTRAPGSRGRTATTSTWPSSTTTWTRPSRRYRLPWTNCAVNPSGSRWTGCTEDWAGHTDPPACVCVSDHKGWRRGVQRYKIIEMKKKKKKILL